MRVFILAALLLSAVLMLQHLHDDRPGGHEINQFAEEGAIWKNDSEVLPGRSCGWQPQS